MVIPKETPRKVVVGPEEAAMVAEAEARKNAGFGSTDPLNIAEEMKIYNEAGITNDDPMTKSENFPKGKPGEKEAQPEEAPEPTGPIPDISEDPAERLMQLHNFLKEITPSAPSLDQLKSWRHLHSL